MLGIFGVSGVVISLYFLYLILFKGYKKIFNVILITSIMTTTTVINIKDNSITVPQIVALMFLFRILIDILVKKINIYKINIILIAIILYIITIVGIKTIIVPSFEPNWYQIIYIIMSISTFYCTYLLIKNKRIDYSNLDRGLRITTNFLFSLAILELFNNKIFNELFKNRVGHNFINTLENGKYRLTVTFNEPSMLATLLVLLLIYFTFSALKSKKDLYYVILIIFIGFLSKGSSFILALMLWGSILIIYYIKKSEFLKLIWFLLIIVSTYLFIEFRFDKVISNQVFELVGKLNGQGTSGIGRITSFRESIDIFKNNPILGVGFGVNRSADLFTTFISNLGIIGSVLMGTFFFRVTRIKGYIKSEIRVIKISLLCCLIILFISVPEPYFSYLWIFIAFSLD